MIANGPYLVTSVPAVRTPLGETLTLPPQLALCRCGASSMKPFCDGTHASSGFTDDKDPNRVPDQRDTYPGQQVTIFDNRGLLVVDATYNTVNYLYKAQGQTGYLGPYIGKNLMLKKGVYYVITSSDAQKSSQSESAEDLRSTP